MCSENAALHKLALCAVGDQVLDLSVNDLESAGRESETPNVY